MSLINDALKKAQKLQMQGQAPPPSVPGGPPGAPGAPGVLGPPGRAEASGRDRPLPGQMFMLFAFGAGALMALSVLATVYLLRHPAAPVVAQAPAATILPEKPAIVPVIKTAPPAPSQAAPPFTPAQNPPSIPAPALAKSPPPASPTTALAAAATPAASRSIQSPAIPMPPRPALALPNGPVQSFSSGLDPSKPDPKILAYVDALQVAGVRLSDTSSKVLMNDRVFRENEIVDHLLGLRLKKIESDTLTFIDERGVIYTKNL